MKDHIRAKLNNDLTAISVKYHGYQCLREMISECVRLALHADENWYRQHPEEKRTTP